MIPTSVFALARMRRLDLLALWHLLHPEAGNGTDGVKAGAMSKEWLVTAVATMDARAPRP